MDITLNFQYSDFEKYFRVAYALFISLACAVVIMLLSFSINFITCLLSVLIFGACVIGFFITKKMLIQIRRLDFKAGRYDEIENRYESKKKTIPEHEPPPPNVAFDIVKVQYDPETKANYLQDVKQKGETIDLEV